MDERINVASHEPLADSERALLSVLFRHRSLPRSDITGLTSLSQQSVHRLLDGLHQRGFVRFGAAEIRGRGKPSPTVELDPEGFATLGLSITTEAAFLCLLDLTGNAVGLQQLDADPNDPALVFAELETRLALPPCASHRLLGIGVALQGYRNGDPQKFFTPLPLAAWRGIPVVTLLEQRLGLPAFAENNATTSATAEFFTGGGADLTCLAYLSFNYGFGGGIFWEGRAMVGAHGNAGELSGFFGTDRMQSRPALGELRKRLNARGIEVGRISDMCANFDPDWPGLRDWIGECGPQLRDILAAIKAIVDPGAIFFGGDAPPELRKMLIAEAQGAFSGTDTPNPALLESRIEGDAAHLGAAFLPLHALVL
ncbi:ROK family transcriptional regulator [Paracoccus sp. (in: a-proteobacteria)]|uniref:ROK family transcriptional regulator n=1 Tax=Paracoccus sp. TaxID=267 RepID=UPI003A8672D8